MLRDIKERRQLVNIIDDMIDSKKEYSRRTKLWNQESVHKHANGQVTGFETLKEILLKEDSNLIQEIDSRLESYTEAITIIHNSPAEDPFGAEYIVRGAKTAFEIAKVEILTLMDLVS